jgi:protein phosphatase 1H
MVYGEGKRSRLLATIGVTRGFGDHDLRAQSQAGTIYIKPFLSPQPEVSHCELNIFQRRFHEMVFFKG